MATAAWARMGHLTNYWTDWHEILLTFTLLRGCVAADFEDPLTPPLASPAGSNFTFSGKIPQHQGDGLACFIKTFIRWFSINSRIAFFFRLFLATRHGGRII